MNNTALRRSDLGMVAWKLNGPMAEAFGIVAHETEEYLRQHFVVVKKARAVGLITEVKAGLQVLRRLAVVEPVCTTDLQTHRALVSCFFTAHFGRKQICRSPFLEVLELLAQMAPCLIEPTSLYFSAEIAVRIDDEVRPIYTQLAREMVEGEPYEVALLDAVRLFPQLQTHGGTRSSALIDELHQITEGYLKAKSDVGATP